MRQRAVELIVFRGELTLKSASFSLVVWLTPYQNTNVGVLLQLSLSLGGLYKPEPRQAIP